VRLPPLLKRIIKILALALGAGADGIMLYACFTSQAVDPLARVAFGAIGIAIVALIPMAYEDKARKFWLALVTVAVFFDTSYLLATTELKETNVTIENDAELAGLTADKKAASDGLALANKDYSDGLHDPTITAKTMESLERRVNKAIEDEATKEQKRLDRFNAVESGLVISEQITADKIFKAIPDAIFSENKRYLQLFMYFMIACILQGMIVFALYEYEPKEKNIIIKLLEKFINRKTVSKKGRPVGSKNNTEIELEDIEKFISANWIGLKTNKTSKILSQSSFMEFYSTRGGFPLGKYKIIKQTAIDREVITPGDEIIIADEDDALEAML
jgi:hypothetical protein